MMDEAKQPELLKNEPKETFASRIERREAEIALAMKEEVERRAAVIKNMHRLRALRMNNTCISDLLPRVAGIILVDLPTWFNHEQKKTAPVPAITASTIKKYFHDVRSPSASKRDLRHHRLHRRR
jgi:hypothetical protein